MEIQVSFYNQINQKLFGIIHIPKKASDLKARVGINLLNPGLKNRVAPNRLNVKLARRLCEMGFFVLRFDPYGIGDSEGELSSTNKSVAELWSMIQKGVFVQDTIAANGYFESEMNLDSLILIGQCGAGVTAGLSGAKDNRVREIILVDTPFRIASPEMTLSRAVLESYNLRQLIKEHARDLIYLQWIKKLFSRKEVMTYLKKKGKMLSYVWNRIKKKNTEGSVSEGFNYDLAESLKQILDNGKRIYFLFAERDFSLREFENDYYPNYLRDEPSYQKRFSVDIIKDANHIYTEIVWQEQLMQNISDWLEKGSSK